MEKYDAYRENNTIGGQDMVQELVRGQQVQVAEQYQEQIQAQKFIVYYTDENIFFIDIYLIKRFGIEPKGSSITVDDIPYIQVYRDDIDYIVSESKGTLIPEYKHYETKKDKKPVDYDYANDGITKNNYYTYYKVLSFVQYFISNICSLSSILKFVLSSKIFIVFSKFFSVNIITFELLILFFINGRSIISK